MTRAFVLSAILLIVMYPTSALAWLRPVYEDATVVERSELIVVARLKSGSIQRGPTIGRRAKRKLGVSRDACHLYRSQRQMRQEGDPGHHSLRTDASRSGC